MANEQEQFGNTKTSGMGSGSGSTASNGTKTESKGEGNELFGGLSQIDPQLALGVVGDFARSNPHVALAGGVAIGFLLGGGLTPRLIGAIGLIAARRYLKQTVNETLESVLTDARG